MSLTARIAAALGWSEADVHSFSYQSLREVVRPVSPKLAHELDLATRSQSYITATKKRRSR